MHMCDDLSILKRRNEILLVNTENGDVYEINDVVEFILQNCSEFLSADSLARKTYETFASENDDFSLEDLNAFISTLVDENIIML